ncbi:MAG TPA: DUF4238 domain-containing protein [Allosphingosinicella sp.]|jgi:hypothetical protein|uniref:DUF4238 domain-containing protein n=1 Tax=Allosphingosinicella sp. TaxID=2823234 RepID=UPI002F28945A
MTVGNPPREHHFVTQSWIKRFVDADGQLYSYDHDSGEVKFRSSKKIMNIRDLYTQDPGGADDTTIETRDLQKVDDDGAKVMSALLAGDLSDAAKARLAEFLSVQIMRDPQRLFDYSRGAQRFLSRLFVEAFTAADFADFQTYFGELVSEDEYDHLMGLGPKQAALEIARIQLRLEVDNWMAELPFTDLIREPEGREKLRDVLLTLEWTLITATPYSFVLGDQGILFDPGQLRRGLRAPLDSSTALILSPPGNAPSSGIGKRAARPYEPSAMNYESAARSRRWVVGAKSALDVVKSQVNGEPLPSREPPAIPS